MNDLERHMKSTEGLIVQIQPELYVLLAQETGKLSRELEELEGALRRFYSSLYTACSLAERYAGKELPEPVRSDLSVYAQKHTKLQACCRIVSKLLAACDRLILSRVEIRSFADNVRYYNLLRAMKVSVYAHERLAEVQQVLGNAPDFSDLLAREYLELLSRWRSVSGVSAAPLPRPNGTDFLE